MVGSVGGTSSSPIWEAIINHSRQVPMIHTTQLMSSMLAVSTLSLFQATSCMCTCNELAELGCPPRIQLATMSHS